LAGGTLTAPRGGMGRLAERLAEVLGPALRTGHRLRSLHRDGEVWSLTFDGQAPVRARRVVLAMPAAAQAEMLRPFAGPLAAEIAAIPSAAVAVAVLGFQDGRQAPAPQGFGYLAPERLGRPVLGTIFSSAIFPHQAPAGRFQTRSIVGGWRRSEVLAWSDAELVECVRNDLRTACGIAAEPEFAFIQRWPGGIPQYHVGHLARLRRIDRATAAWPGLTLAGTAYRGVAVEDCAREAERLAEQLAPAPIQ
jgi:protoporphyrinogen/coproporphyrinogen III oxidase